MKILVTGGAGFIGSNVVDLLVTEGHDVCVVDNLITGKLENLKESKEKIRFHEVDITSPELDNVFEKEKPEAVFHIAAQIDVRKSIKDPKWDAKVNIIGTINVLECMREHGTKKIVYSSTGGAIYGDTENIPTPESQEPFPSSGYGTSKYCSERYLHYYNSLYGIDFTILRYGNVYGPRQDPLGEAGVVSIFIGNILRGKDCRINGDGRQTRDYCFVKDIARANLTVLSTQTKNKIFNIGTGKETGVNELYDTIAEQVNELTGKTSSKYHTDAIPGELLRSCLDTKRANTELGWKPKVLLSEGIRETAEFFRDKM